ncbi:hypothetical protein G9U51_07995 [Calidifontibacter sp. DB0510]|uniref:Uncharacterized protein n=1 Tax=Metallococcus carri TaxID=1656884 RepID=A0A967AZ26_9MICO|nr:hypothetical protein [Metallococcus carri]NHN55716.1 hypothetical protein [Metallococcus carri]NOP38595.1 hypothetical protein [Calidifontibacter sp. DB2511S]
MRARAAWQIVVSLLAVVGLQCLVLIGFSMADSGPTSSPSVLVVSADSGWSGLVANRINAVEGHPVRAFVVTNRATAHADLAGDRTQAVLAVDPAAPADALSVSSAQGQGANGLVATTVRQVLAAEGRSVTTTDVTSTQVGDPRSLGGYRLAVAWVVAGFGLGAALRALDLLRRLRVRLLAHLVGAVSAAAAGVGVAQMMVPTWSFVALPLLGIGTAIVLAGSLLTDGLGGAFGPIGFALAAVAQLLVVADPQFAGAFGLGVVPAWWRAVLPWTPAGSAVGGVRALLYLPGSVQPWSVATLVWWAVFGLLLSLLTGPRRPARHALRSS